MTKKTKKKAKAARRPIPNNEVMDKDEFDHVIGRLLKIPPKPRQKSNHKER